MGQVQCCPIESKSGAEATIISATNSTAAESNADSELSAASMAPTLLASLTPKGVEKTKGVSFDNTESETSSKFVVDDSELRRSEQYARNKLSIVVLGATGDLAKKKTFPSLVDLYHHAMLPQHVSIVAFARSELDTEAFRSKLRPDLLKEKEPAIVDSFLSRLSYCKGEYGSIEAFSNLNHDLQILEASSNAPEPTTRLFYFAVPPDAFLPAASAIKQAATCTGSNKLIVEKPFGRDFKSAKQLISSLEALFSESCIYRIDHYLGKEIVQNLPMFRFGNRVLEPLLNRNHVASVRITFKEPFGTEGRGGYFTKYGIIRDVIQNHLMQVLSLLAMEPPKSLMGPKAATHVRDAKVAAVKAIRAIDPKEVVVGQYVGANGKPGYLDDDSIKDKSDAEFVATFAAMVLRVNTSRWKGVPFHIKAGKALDEGKAEIRIQFKDAAKYGQLFASAPGARNELVMRLQPSEAIYMKVDIKDPGLQQEAIQSELDLTYKRRYPNTYNPAAYTRLLLDALKGKQENFVRNDELLASWKLFDPVLSSLEAGAKRRKPIPYEYGSRGPIEADELFARSGFQYVEGEYDWKE